MVKLTSFFIGLFDSSYLNFIRLYIKFLEKLLTFSGSVGASLVSCPPTPPKLQKKVELMCNWMSIVLVSSEEQFDANFEICFNSILESSQRCWRCRFQFSGKWVFLLMKFFLKLYFCFPEVFPCLLRVKWWFSRNAKNWLEYFKKPADYHIFNKCGM